ncbi:MAG: hypothetical protein NC124_02155 [Clostridium sp.]|nr:hypothetical protein [Clostridium sp.]
MEIKPDYRFTKLHTSKGTIYTFSIYLGIEKSFFGWGNTIKDAVKSACDLYGEEISDVENFLKYLDEFGSAINVPEYQSKIKEFHAMRKDVLSRECAFCGGELPPNRKRFCCNECSKKFYSRYHYLKKVSKRFEESIEDASKNKISGGYQKKK